MDPPGSTGARSEMLVRPEGSNSSELLTSESTLSETASVKSASRRRSSSRKLKRKRFADEEVEMTSNVQPPASRPPTLNISTRNPSASSITFDDFAIPSIIPPNPIISSVIQPKRRNRQHTRSNVSNRAGRRSTKNKNPNPSINATKDLGRWKPTDDMALVIAVQQTNDLKMVHKGTKFSCRFTLQEVQSRWHALLYDTDISKLAVQAMRNLHPEVISSVQARALFSKAEEDLLETIKSTPEPTLEIFQGLLEGNPQTFYPARTAKALMYHWQLMAHYQLLPDQCVQPLPGPDDIMSFSDAEAMMDNRALTDQKEEMIDSELAMADRQNKREIRVLENELSRWLVLVDSVTGAIVPDFDNQTLAILKGKLVKYRMKSKEISVGRSTKENSVDVDLTLEGPAGKVSRRQATIRMRDNGDFFLSSEGKRPIIVDGRPILAGNKIRLQNNSVIEIAGLHFVFLINQELKQVLRQEWVNNFELELKPQNSKRRR